MSTAPSDQAADRPTERGQVVVSQLQRELPEPVRYIENVTFDEIKIGDGASLSRTLTPDDIALFALASGDINPAHLDPEYARTDMFHHIIVHGMWTAGLISALLGTKYPGPGASIGSRLTARDSTRTASRCCAAPRSSLRRPRRSGVRQCRYRKSN